MTVAEGLLVLDKPAGITSRTAVDRAMRWFPRGTRIGHTGTLDPLATGVLVLCLGGATRLTEYVQRMSKTYRTRLRLGARSDTDDADGAIVPVADANPPGTARVTATLSEFVGVIAQTPPAYSAAKLGGQRAYDLARSGHEVALQPRSVTIHAITLLDYRYPHLDLEVHCGKGTYIRSLARDAGARLGCGALVETLRRTRLGPFSAEEALTLDADAEKGRASVLPLEMAVAELPRIVLDEDDVRRLRQGQSVSLGEIPSSGQEEETALFDNKDRLIGIGMLDSRRNFLRPAKVLRS
jgi:tRNA pseudouridine55 synthase